MVALLAGGLGAGLGASFANTASPSAPPSAAPLAPQTSNGADFAQQVADAVDPAVVDIDTTVASPNGSGATEAAGTGMIISSSGLVLTNNHVVNRATTIRVTVPGHSGTYPGTVVGVDTLDDIALVKITGLSGLPTVSFGNSSNVTLGASVVAIGNALGQGGTPTVVTGAISALGRTITAGEQGSTVTETLHNMLQTTAPIVPGDSGGPLVDTSGQVIGMDTAAATADTGTTLGFAIPIDRARRIVSMIESGTSGKGVVIGVPAFLGIYVDSPGSSFASPGIFGSSGAPSSGVTISGVIQGSPAAMAGMTGGDTITAVGGHATATFDALKTQIATYAPGKTVTVTYVNPSGAKMSVSVTLAGLPN